MLRRHVSLVPSTPTTRATGTRTTGAAFAAPPLLLEFPRRFTNEERSPRDKPASSRVSGRRRHPLERMRIKPSSRNISLTSPLDDEATAAAAAAAKKDGGFSMRPAQYQQSMLRTSERLERDEQMLWRGAVISDIDAANPVAQHFLRMHQNPVYRTKQKKFLLTGESFIDELLRKHAKAASSSSGATLRPPKHLLVRSDREAPEWTKTRFGRGTEVIKVKPDVLDALYPGNDGFVGDFEMPDAPLKEELMVNTRKFRSVLVLDNIDDPGLLGNMVRSAAAFAYDAVFLVNHCADWFHHDALRASRGVQFQTLTPVYVLKSENGDDVAAMLNHVVARNGLKPLLLTPKVSSGGGVGIDADKADAPPVLSPIARAALEASAATGSDALKQQIETHAQQRAERKTLHQIMLDSYCGWSSESGAGGAASAAAAPASSSSSTDSSSSSSSSGGAGQRIAFEPGRHMLCVSADRRGNFEARMQRVFAATPGARPTTLLLEEPPEEGEDRSSGGRMREATDLVDLFPAALYQLRHTASWDFLPASMRNAAAASDSLSDRAMNPAFGTAGDGDIPGAGSGPQDWDRERNLSEEEFAHKIRTVKTDRMLDRRNRWRHNSDTEVWRKLESERVLLDAAAAAGQQQRPRAGARASEDDDISSLVDVDPIEQEVRLERRRRDLDARRERTPIPNEMLERQELMNRDVLRELEQWAGGYEAPPNYEARSKTPQWAPEKWGPEEAKKTEARRSMWSRLHSEAEAKSRAKQKQRDDSE